MVTNLAPTQQAGVRFLAVPLHSPRPLSTDWGASPVCEMGTHRFYIPTREGSIPSLGTAAADILCGMTKRLSDMSPDEANMERIRRKLRNARREIIKAVERAAKVDDQIGLRRGHKIEMLRQVREVEKAADQATKEFENMGR